MYFQGNQQRNLMKTLILLDFDIDRPQQCLTIPLNYTSCDEGDDILKTKLDEQLKEMCKCHHQECLNTKLIINNINKSNCLE